MSDLGINYGILRREVGRYLGFDRDPSAWGTNETQDVQDVIDAGLRQFYRPPRLPEEKVAHQWSWLIPWGHITLITDEWDYDMPADFGSIIGNLYYVTNDFITREITVVPTSHIQNLRQRFWYTTTNYEPKLAAIVVKKHDGGSQTTYQLQLYPKPDEAYTLTFQYYVREASLRNDNDVPLGGPEHAETVRASCMAAAEAHLDDAIGEKRSLFMDQLRSSVDFDRRASEPMTLGENSDPSMYRRGEDGYIRSTRLTRYEKFPM